MVLKPEACSPQFGKPSFPTKESFSADMSLPRPCQTEPGCKALAGREGKSVSPSCIAVQQITHPGGVKQRVFIFSSFLWATSSDRAQWEWFVSDMAVLLCSSFHSHFIQFQKIRPTVWEVTPESKKSPKNVLSTAWCRLQTLKVLKCLLLLQEACTAPTILCNAPMSLASAHRTVHCSGDQCPRQSFRGSGEVVVVTQTEGNKMEGVKSRYVPEPLHPQVSQWGSVAA